MAFDIRMLQIPINHDARRSLTDELHFPLKEAPKCRTCEKPCERRFAGSNNRNGNSGRPYYVYVNSIHDRELHTRIMQEELTL
jgi:hypothetical protein